MPRTDESPTLDLEAGVVPFLDVPGTPPHAAAEALEWRGKPAALMFEPGELDRFVPIDGIEIPPGTSYLVEGVDTGHEFLNATPNDALAQMLDRGRSPLTVEEGIALIAAHPGILRKNFCFSLPGSRCGDKRVPAIWISDGVAKVGWCWAGNPHTWLGNASCARRSEI